MAGMALLGSGVIIAKIKTPLLTVLPMIDLNIT